MNGINTTQAQRNDYLSHLLADQAENQKQQKLNKKLKTLESGNGPDLSLDQLIAKKTQDMGFPIMPLESELLLSRVEKGDWSGNFLAKAFLSAFDVIPFELSLGTSVKLVAQGLRLFHQIIHIRQVENWSEEEYNEIAAKIEDIARERRFQPASFKE